MGRRSHPAPSVVLYGALGLNRRRQGLRAATRAGAGQGPWCFSRRPGCCGAGPEVRPSRNAPACARLTRLPMTGIAIAISGAVSAMQNEGKAQNWPRISVRNIPRNNQIRSGLSVRNSSDSEDLKVRHGRGNVSNPKRAGVVREHVCKRRLRQDNSRLRVVSERPARINPCGGQLAIGSVALHR